MTLSRGSACRGVWSGKIIREEDCREQVGGAPSKHIPTLPSLPAAAYITQDDISLAKIKFTPFSRKIYRAQGPYFFMQIVLNVSPI